MNPKLTYGNGTWACVGGQAWGVDADPVRAYRRWQDIAHSLQRAEIRMAAERVAQVTHKLISVDGEREEGEDGRPSLFTHAQNVAQKP